MALRLCRGRLAALRGLLPPQARPESSDCPAPGTCGAPPPGACPRAPGRRRAVQHVTCRAPRTPPCLANCGPAPLKNQKKLSQTTAETSCARAAGRQAGRGEAREGEAEEGEGRHDEPVPDARCSPRGAVALEACPHVPQRVLHVQRGPAPRAPRDPPDAPASSTAPRSATQIKSPPPTKCAPKESNPKAILQLKPFTDEKGCVASLSGCRPGPRAAPCAGVPAARGDVAPCVPLTWKERVKRLRPDKTSCGRDYHTSATHFAISLDSIPLESPQPLACIPRLRPLVPSWLPLEVLKDYFKLSDVEWKKYSGPPAPPGAVLPFPPPPAPQPSGPSAVEPPLTALCSPPPAGAGRCTPPPPPPPTPGAAKGSKAQKKYDVAPFRKDCPLYPKPIKTDFQPMCPTNR